MPVNSYPYGVFGFANKKMVTVEADFHHMSTMNGQ